MSNQDIFAGDYNIDTPESVAFDYTIADVGNRSIAAAIDMFLVVLALSGLNAALVALLAASGVNVDFLSLDEGGVGWAGGLAIALYAILDFVVFWGYFMLSELKWNGQTIGKQALKIRVVRVDGSPAAAGEVAVRNLVRIIDFLPTGYLLGLGVMLTNAKAQRLGDLAAGTLVVKADVRVTLDQLVQSANAAGKAASQPEPRAFGTESTATGPDGQVETHDALAADVLAAEAHGLDVRSLRATDYALILDVLGRDAANPLQAELLVRLATAIALKTGYHGNVKSDPRRFLRQVAEAYRQKAR